MAYVQGHAEGNPFYAGEILRALEEERTLRPHGAGWQLGDIAGARLPPLLRQVLDGRLDRLGEATRGLLAVAAVIGQEVPLDLWAAVAETDEEALVVPTEQAVEARILVELADGTVARFAHALIRAVLYQGMGALRRRALHRRVADALLVAAHPDPDAVAYHLRQASDPRAAGWLIRAGDRARRAYASMTAGARYEAALVLLETAGADASERGWLAFRLAHTYWLADPQRSLAELAQAAPLAEEADDRALVVSIALEHGFLLCMVGQMRRGLAEIEAVVPVIEALPVADRVRLSEGHDAQNNPRGLLAEWFAWTGRFADALAMGARVVPEAPPDTAARDIPYVAYANAYLGLAVAHAGQGRPDEARRAFAAARVCNVANGHAHQLGMNARQELSWVVLLYQADRIAERHLLANEAEQAWRRASGARPDIIPASATLPLMLLEGRWAEAHAVATELHASRSSGWSRIVANDALAYLAYETGDLTEAWARATEDLTEGPDTLPGDVWLLDTLPVQRLAALVAIERGEYPAARAWLTCHDRWLDWAGAALGRAEAALCWARYHRATGATIRAREQAELALAHAMQPRQPLALLAAHRLLGSLDSEARRYDAAMAHLNTALALADACAAPYARALTLLDLAEFRVGQGDREAGQAALDAARPVFVDLGAKPALARVDALVSRLTAPPVAPVATLPFGLTAREVGVLRLVAQGLTDLQVADQLFVSRHTVNSHLKAICGKLGVTSRAAATRLALEHRLA